jgi:serine beta-lactamase-like protein LACTB, mitochondrial
MSNIASCNTGAGLSHHDDSGPEMMRMFINHLDSAFLCIVALAATPVSPAQCIPEKTKQVQEPTVVADTSYSSQIQLARKAAMDIYEHGLVGNSGSAINGKMGHPPGMAVAVAVEGRLVWAEALGISDLEHCVAATPDTKFRIGSTSKPLTAVGAALLADQGRLDLDAPIQRYVPAFPDKGYVITTRELLAHLGGIRGYTTADGDIENQTPYASVTASLNRFKDDPLIAPPGSNWKYSAYGYVLASAVIEGAAHQPFLTFMHNSVFVPLGMTDTMADNNEDIIQNRSRWYNLRSDGSYRNSPYADLSYKWAAGGFLSTVTDLVRFGSALLQPGFLRKETLASIFTVQNDSTGSKLKYGLGWEIHEAGDGQPERHYEHGGGATGSSSLLIIYPDQKVVIAWLMNSDDFRDWPLRNVASPFFPQRP